MERLLSRILYTFSAGFAVIGLVVGLLKVNTPDSCGAVLWHEEGCSQPTSLLAMVIGLFGLAVTSALAGWMAGDAVPRGPEDPPVVYPGGAQV